jgi:hypothetical protein
MIDFFAGWYTELQKKPIFYISAPNSYWLFLEFSIYIYIYWFYLHPCYCSCNSPFAVIDGDWCSDVHVKDSFMENCEKKNQTVPF